MFKHRLNSSYRHAVEYVKQFPSPITSLVAKLVSYIPGAFAAVILLISLIDESLLEGHIGKHNLIWYTAFFASTVLMVSRSPIMEDYQIFDPVGVMRQITFLYKAALFFEEIMSIIVTPFILIFALPKCVDDVMLFVQDFTVLENGPSRADSAMEQALGRARQGELLSPNRCSKHAESATSAFNVGHVCSLSVFDFEHHGNFKYGYPFHTSKDRWSSQGKMEKSL